MAKKFYAYFIIDSKDSGIVENWDLCKNIIAGKKTRYKSFKSFEEAKNWLDSGALYEKKEDIKNNLPEGIYFDAGTGRGIGVEVRVTLKDGKSILKENFPDLAINEFGNYLTKEGRTNNYGELAGIYLALTIATNLNIKNIYGDSSLVIDYWSKGLIKSTVAKDTIALAKKVKIKRDIFENSGGKITKISGDYNPADLGFHK